MKQITTYPKKFTAFILLMFFMQSCIKDNILHTYTISRPVYKSIAEVRSNIKSNTSVPVKNTGKLFVIGNYIFLNEVDKGIHVIDNTNPQVPVNKYFINIPGNIDMAVKGNILYADLYQDLITLDISDPTNVKVKKIIDNVFPHRRYSNGFMADSNMVIVDWITKDTTVADEKSGGRFFSLTDAMAFSSMNKSANASSAPIGVSGSMARFTMMNNYLYTVTENALNVFNISQPEQPVFSNKVPVGWNIETIYPFKDNLFIGSMTGMFIYGTSNAAMPNRLGSFSHARACDPVIADDKFAFVTLRAGTVCGTNINQLDVIDVANVTNPMLVKSYGLTGPRGLSKDGNTLFVCDGKGGLKVYDATDVRNLLLLQQIDGINPFDVIAMNGLAIVVSKEGLLQYDYTDVKNIKLLSKLSIN